MARESSVLTAQRQRRDCHSADRSLVYQIFPLIVNKKAIIITPTISLMHDQEQSLNRFKIPHLSINSGTPKDKQFITTALDPQSDARVILINVEFLYAKNVWTQPLISKFADMAKEGHIGLVALDEAHLVEEWAHFRPYWAVRQIRSQIPGIPILCVTATALPSTKKLLVEMLQDPEVIQASVDRPNIFQLPRIVSFCQFLTRGC